MAEPALARVAQSRTPIPPYCNQAFHPGDCENANALSSAAERNAVAIVLTTTANDVKNMEQIRETASLNCLSPYSGSTPSATRKRDTML